MRWKMIVGLCMSLSTAAFAADAPYTELAEKMCLQTGLDLQKIEAVVKSMNGKEVPENERVKPNAREWVFDNGSPIIWAYYEQKKINDKPYVQCSITFPKLDADGAMASIQRAYKVKLLSDETEDAHRYVIFRSDMPELNNPLISVMASGKTNETAISITKRIQ